MLFLLKFDFDVFITKQLIYFKTFATRTQKNKNKNNFKTKQKKLKLH